MSCTATEFLNVARSQIGYREGANNDNRYGIWYGWNHAPYCAIGLSWAAAVANAGDIMGGKWAYCPFWVTYWKRLGRWHGPNELAAPGDIVFFDWSGRHALAEHVGVVESVDHTNPSNPVPVTIEFNTSSGIAGSQSDGGGVYRRRRNTLYVVGYGRPAYKRQPRPVPIPSRDHDRKLVPLVVDGVWGRLTTQHLQVWLRVKPIGVIDHNTRRHLQEALGVEDDGIWGPQTRRALQRRLGVPTDGVWGPQTVKGLQRFLNRIV